MVVKGPLLLLVEYVRSYLVMAAPLFAGAVQGKLICPTPAVVAEKTTMAGTAAGVAEATAE